MFNGIKSIRRCFVLAIGLLLISGCSEQALYTGLTEQEANEIVALLHRANMQASKVGGKEGRFDVATDEKYFSSAVQLLQANGLPRTQFDTLGDVFSDQSFVSSSTAQRARYIHALSQEISHTISSIDGVLLARVHLSVPDKDPLSEESVESSASVFVKHRPNVDLSPHIGQIKALVVNGLENLPYDNVTVALFESTPEHRLISNTPLVMHKEELSVQAMGMVSWLGMALVGGGVLMFLGISLLMRKKDTGLSSGMSKAVTTAGGADITSARVQKTDSKTRIQ